MTMKTITSREFQKNFGSVSDIVIREGEIVSITKHGRPSMYIMPVSEETSEAIRMMAGKRLIKKMNSMPPTNPNAPDLSLEDINKLVHELRP